MNTYERIYNLLLETSFGNPQLKYIMTSPENVMSGATRTYKKGAKKARQTGVRNKGEDKILNVPRTFKGMLRRGRRTRQKAKMKKFNSDTTPK